MTNELAFNIKFNNYLVFQAKFCKGREIERIRLI
jgi:hypothetical protein